MASRRHKRLLLGVGAFLGLCAAGCYPSSFTGSVRPNGLLEVVAARHEERPAAELLRPRVAGTQDVTSAKVPAASSSGVRIEPPVVRASVASQPNSDELPSEAVEASSWRSLVQTPEPEMAPGLDLGPTPDSNPCARLQPTRLAHEAVEALPPPRKSDGKTAASLTSEVAHLPPAAGHAGPHPYAGGLHHGGGYPGAPVPREGQKAPLPPYMIEPPDVLIVQLVGRDPKRVPQPLDGQFLVRPDGTINLGVYGTVGVAGLTLDQARDAIAARLSLRLKPQKELDENGKETGNTIPIADELVVDVLEFASKFCYLIADGAGFGEQVVRVPVNGSDTVLDVVGKVGGLPSQSSKKKIWIARAAAGHLGHQQILPVDWVSIAQRGWTDTNYQVYPGDRIYVHSDALLRTDSKLSKILNPIERLLGTTLLGSSVVNSIKRGGGNNSGNNFNN